jgi:hypothetical protein
MSRTRARNNWTAKGTSGANAAQTVQKAAQTNACHYVTSYLVVIRAAAAGADIGVAIKDGDDNILWQDYIGNAAARGSRCGFSFPDAGLKIPAGKAAKIVVDAGGAGVITEANLFGYTE